MAEGHLRVPGVVGEKAAIVHYGLQLVMGGDGQPALRVAGRLERQATGARISTGSRMQPRTKC